MGSLLQSTNDIKFRYSEPLIFDIHEIEEASKIIERIKSLEKKYEFIHNSLRNFYDLRSIPEESNLLIVGYFSIIESLVAHKPRQAESLDSISSQLKNKLILLFKKFPSKVDYSYYFGKGKSHTIWGKLYTFRSGVAHGNEINFKGDLQILKSKHNVQLFLKEVIKNLLLLSINDPEFIKDLKSC